MKMSLDNNGLLLLKREKDEMQVTVRISCYLDSISLLYFSGDFISSDVF
jgi:hypothetical protein